MGSTLVKSGKIGDTDYRIFNIDNIYTVYIKIGTQPNTTNNVLEPIYSAIKSFSNLEEAEDYLTKLSK